MNYYIEKQTGTPADTLLAFGVAQLLHLLQPTDADNRLTLEDVGTVYRITLGEPLDMAQLATVDFFPLILGLNTKTKKAAVPESQAVDYLAEQQKNRAYFEARDKLKDEQVLQEQGFHPPHKDWPIWAKINQLSATPTYNKLVALWYLHHTCFPALLQLILNLYSQYPNDREQAVSDWKALLKQEGLKGAESMAQLQVVNPAMGKGGNRSKADGLGIGGLKGFWLEEYLKFAGFYQAGIPRTVRGNKDRKTYILRPKRLLWHTHQQVFPAFQKVFYGQTAVKMDIFATLLYTQTFIEQWQAGQGSTHRRARNPNPGNHVSAIETVYYKDMGSAHATLNLSAFALPNWMPITNKTGATQFLDLLDEHRRIVYRLDESHGDAYALLRLYRAFLSGRDLAPFFQFMRGYSQHLMSELAGRNNPPQFSCANLEVLFMTHDQSLSPILQNEGFQHIAEAIRRSTVLPQRQKANGRDTLYEIRYGLGDKLMRHSQYPDEFVQALSAFIHAYNRENGRKLETRKQQFRRNITNEDIEAIVQLIDTYSAKTIASLLVAYGYARDSKKENTSEGEKES